MLTVNADNKKASPPELPLPMDQHAATARALQIPEMLTNTLRCLGPLEWIKCASVCSYWCSVILGGDDKTERGKPVEVAATPKIATDTEDSAALPSAGKMVSAAVEDGKEAVQLCWEEKGDGQAKIARVSNKADLWCEFAITTMGYRDPCVAAQTGDNDIDKKETRVTGDTNCCSGSVHCRSEQHHRTFNTAKYRGRRSLWRRGISPESVPESFYRNICLEGDPAVLGPPLRAMVVRVDSNTGYAGELKVTTVSLKDISTASAARNRHPRALTEFLLQWTRCGHKTSTNIAKVDVCANQLEFTMKMPLCRKKKGTNGGSSKRTIESRKVKTKAACPSKSCATTTAILNDALSVFTRLLVLCRRCRRPCTALFASEDNGGERYTSVPRSGSNSSAGGNAANVSGWKKPAASALSATPGNGGRGRRGVTLWVECQGEDCGLTSRVGVSSSEAGGFEGGTRPPPWLVKYSKFVLKRGWKRVNTLEEGYGTEWFSDTSPAAVRRRQDEARASSIGLDVLARRASGGGRDSDSNDSHGRSDHE